jgi:hypothetical protein
MNKTEHYANAKAVIGFLILALGCAMLLLFKNYQDAFLQPGTYVFFFSSIFIGAALLLGLFYLVSQSGPEKAVAHKASKPKAAKKKRK